MIRHKKTTLTILILTLAVVFYLGAADTAETASVRFLDVGQGDATLISLPGNIQILVDGGPGSAVLAKLARYMPFGDREVELVVLTHPHADHMSGLNGVARNYEIGNVLLSGARYESKTYKNFISELAENGANIFVAARGDKISWDGEVILEVLSPGEVSVGKDFGHIHETNVVTMLTLGGHSFLLTGDADEELEKEIMDAGLISDVDVLKVGHHGSKTSSGASFLNTALAEVAVVPVGKNSYGHPYPAIMERIARLGTKILRTDEAGDISWHFRLE